MLIIQCLGNQNAYSSNSQNSTENGMSESTENAQIATQAVV